MNAIVNFFKKLNSPMTTTVDSGEVYHFNGGVHPPENKLESTQLPIIKLSLPGKLVLPLRQHVGNLPKLKVSVGDRVLKGQLLAESEGMVSAAVHAPTSGMIVSIADAIIPHPSGLPDLCITLIPDGKEEWCVLTPQDWKVSSKQQLISSLRLSGIVGLGGATFPTHVKLNVNQSKVHTLVVNAAECEPYITCDDMLMREHAEEVVQGVVMAQYLLGAEAAVIGIEDNKPEAVVAMKLACKSYANLQVKVVPTLYPSGDARRLIRLLLGMEIPSDQRATDWGVQVFNVATLHALYRFFHQGEPAISRVVTMAGNVKTPRNFEVLFGTPLQHLVEAAGGVKSGTTHYIMGGPMMGFNLPSVDVAITKAANCIIAATPHMFEMPPLAMPCIRCARCADACPVNLQPQELYWFSKADNFEKARDYQLFDCIECGVCSYVCPSNIPLVQYYRYAKSEIIALDKAKEAADLARERNEFKLMRIEREKQERTQKHAQRAEAGKVEASQLETGLAQASGAGAATTDEITKKMEKQAAIAAAIERAKALKAQAVAIGEVPKNIENVSPVIQTEIAETDARREAVFLEKAVVAKTSTMANADAEKQAKIAAAIARAKAQKVAADALKNEGKSEMEKG